jgi:hypothetical protein
MLKARHVILALALVLALLGDSWGRSHRPLPSHRQQNSAPQAQTQTNQQQTPDNRGTEQSPLIVRTIKSKEEAAEAEQDRKDKTWNDNFTMGLTGLLAVVGALQLGTFIVMIRTSRRQLRAYVSVVGNGMTPQIKEGDKFIHNLKAINTGQTPARDLRVKCITKILDHPVPNAFDFSLAADPLGSNYTVGSNKDVTFDAVADRSYSFTELNEVADPKSKKRFYSYGTIQYLDVFGCEHITEFCLWLEPSTDSEGKPCTLINASEHHNKQS